MAQINNPPIVKRSFTASMNYVDRVADHDNEWIISNNNSFFKLGGSDTTVTDTETASVGVADTGITRATWFIVPFDMTVTHVSGVWQDDDMTTHISQPQNYAGIWKIEGFGTAGSDPGNRTGTQTFELAYITDGSYLNNGYLWSWTWFDKTSNFSLDAGDAVFAGTMIPRSSGGDGSTLTMTLCGDEIL